jgi:hypothetical protein
MGNPDGTISVYDAICGGAAAVGIFVREKRAADKLLMMNAAI